MILGRWQRSASSWLVASSLLVLCASAGAQTWTGNRQGPELPELMAVDLTGEPGWLWGREDVSGDGLNTFDAPEQAIDGRAVYVTTAANRLWFRMTLSATVAPEGNLVAYLFVDADNNSGTGRTAAATEVDPAFASDPTPGGYEYVFAVRGDGSVDGLYQLANNGNAFTPVSLSATDLVAESGTAVDPLRIGPPERGYVQGQILESLVGVGSQCDARFFARATNDNAILGTGDITIGEFTGCVPADTNTDQVPDVLEPTVECTTSGDCVAGAVCWNNRCWLAPTCITSANCAATETCVNGQCRATGGDGCTGPNDCGTLVCQNQQCVACTTNASCGTGRVCAPSGQCVDEATANNQATNGGASSVGGTGGNGGSGGTGANSTAAVGGNGNGAGNQNNSGSAGEGVILGEGERVQGGACACHVAGQSRGRPAALAWLGLVGLGLLLSRRVRAQERNQ